MLLQLYSEQKVIDAICNLENCVKAMENDVRMENVSSEIGGYMLRLAKRLNRT